MLTLRWFQTRRASNALAPGYEDHNYAYVTPVVGGRWALLGETGKYVPLSSTRIAKVVLDASTGALEVALHGAEGESVEFCAWDTQSKVAVCQTLAFGSNGWEQRITFGA